MSNINLRAIRSGNTLNVIYQGRHYEKTGDQVEELYEHIMHTKANPTPENREKLETMLDPLAREQFIGPVERDGMGNYYLEGTSVPLPGVMVEHMQELAEYDIPVDSVVKFWKRSLLNPNPQARQDFFEYCLEHGITFTDEGYAILYKAVNNNPGGNMDEDLVDFIGTRWLKVMRMNEDPADHYVIEVAHEHPGGVDISYELVPQAEWDNHEDPRNAFGHSTQATTAGTLKELYDQASTSATGQFRPGYTRGEYGQNINLGEPVTMPRAECDPSIDQSCSKGLHIGSYDYVSSFGQDMDTILATLVSPRDIVALPKADNSKLRTCRYTPYAIMDRDEKGHWTEIEEVHVDEDTLIDEEDLAEQFRELQEKQHLTEEEEAQKQVLQERVQQLDIDSSSWDSGGDQDDQDRRSGGSVSVGGVGTRGSW